MQSIVFRLFVFSLCLELFWLVFDWQKWVIWRSSTIVENCILVEYMNTLSNKDFKTQKLTSFKKNVTRVNFRIFCSHHNLEYTLCPNKNVHLLCPPQLKNVTTIPCERYTLGIWSNFHCFPQKLDASEIANCYNTCQVKFQISKIA